MSENKFAKKERLCNFKLIHNVVKKGKSFKVFPFYIKYLKIDYKIDEPVKILFTVPKKKFKKAVTRNLLKRRSKNSYRQNKRKLYDNIALSKEDSLLIIVTYIDTKLKTYQEINNSIISIITQLSNI